MRFVENEIRFCTNSPSTCRDVRPRPNLTASPPTNPGSDEVSVSSNEAVVKSTPPRAINA